MKTITDINELKDVKQGDVIKISDKRGRELVEFNTFDGGRNGIKTIHREGYAIVRNIYDGTSLEPSSQFTLNYSSSFKNMGFNDYNSSRKKLEKAGL